MTRKDHLVQLVAGRLAAPGTVLRHPAEDDEPECFDFYAPDLEMVMEDATNALAAIEKELGEVRGEDGRMRNPAQQHIDAEVSKAVAAERERCAKIAEMFGESPHLRDDIAAEIRRGK